MAAQFGLTFGTHYCQGKRVHTSILLGSSEVPDCGMKMKGDCAHGSDNGIPSFEKHCCDDERNTFRNEREQLPSAPAQLQMPRQKPELLHTALFDEGARSSALHRVDLERPPPSGLSASRRYSVCFQVFRV